MAPQRARPTPILVKIIDGLYIGDIYGASDENELKSCGISAILSAVDGGKEDYPDISCSNHELISLQDAPTNSMLPHLRTLFDFISLHREGGRGVLVHCIFGISRSSSAIIAYLLLKNPSWSFDQALDVVHEKYPNAAPAGWFRRELRLLDKGAGLEFYQANNNCYSGINPVILLRSNSITPSSPSRGGDWARCRKCRADLFPSSVAFAANSDGNQILLSTQTNGSLMETRNSGGGERLHCTKCRTKVGFIRDYQWVAGMGYGGFEDIPISTVALSCIDWPLFVDRPKSQCSLVKLKTAKWNN